MRKTWFFRNRRGGSASRQIATSSRVMRRATSDEAQVAELVDAYVSGAYAERCAGSSPVLGTKVIFFIIVANQLRRRAGGEIGIHATLRG